MYTQRKYPPAPTYPHIERVMGWKWLSTWQGRLTEVELARMEQHFAQQASK
jgi:hypothetical protein